MLGDWQARFDAFTGRERAAFRKLEEVFYKLNAKTPMAGIDEFEQAYTAWQATTKALADFLLDFHAQQAKLGHQKKV